MSAPVHANMLCSLQKDWIYEQTAWRLHADSSYDFLFQEQQAGQAFALTSTWFAWKQR
jgi:hypothetical protein